MLRPSLFTLPPNIRISEQITNKRILKWVVCLFCNGWYLCWRWAKNTSLDETVPLLKNLYICVESSIIHNQKVETIQKSNNWQRDKQNVVYPNRILSSNKKVHAGLPRCHSGKEPTCQCRRLRRHRFDSWVGKMLSLWHQEGWILEYSWAADRNPEAGRWRLHSHRLSCDHVQDLKLTIYPFYHHFFIVLMSSLPK